MFSKALISASNWLSAKPTPKSPDQYDAFDRVLNRLFNGNAPDSGPCLTAVDPSNSSRHLGGDLDLVRGDADPNGINPYTGYSMVGNGINSSGNPWGIDMASNPTDDI